MRDNGGGPDTGTVLEILRGAADGTGDPDVALASRLADLVDATHEVLDATLKDLLRDAHPH